MLRRLLSFIILLEFLGFFSASLLHTGMSLFGYVEIHNPTEAIIQGLIALSFLVALIGIYLKKDWAWTAAVAVHAIAVVGAIFGIIAALKNGWSVGYNLYNGFRALLLLSMLILLCIPKVKKRLRY